MTHSLQFSSFSGNYELTTFMLCSQCYTDNKMLWKFVCKEKVPSQKIIQVPRVDAN